jgi:hypothetical protein
MLSLRTRLVIALDAGSVQGTRLVSGLRGRELRGLARRALAGGALVPAALAPNVLRPEEVREAMRAVATELGAVDRPTILVLPDGVARSLLLDVPAGTDAHDFARFRLAPQLPYAAADAIVEVMPIGPRRVLAAAIRRDIAAEYEQLASASGLKQERLDWAPMAALGALRRHGGEQPHIDVVLGEAAFSMALVAQGTTLAFRGRRRDPGPDEPERLSLELMRTAQLGATAEAAAHVRVVGPGAHLLADAWSAQGVRVQSGWGEVRQIPAREASELSWLGAALC